MREMKDSGVEWIGNIPVDWDVRKVKAILNLQTGFTPDTKNEDYYSDDGVDWVTIGDLNGQKFIPASTKKKISNDYVESFSPQIVPAGSLLYSFKLSVGQTAFTDRPVYTNEAIASFLETNDYSMEFLRFASFLIEYNANTNIYGAHLLNQELIKNALIVVPPVDQQRRIAAFLDMKIDQVDALIANVQVQIEKLKAYKQSLITEVVTKGLDPTVPMKDSGVENVGEIPSHWEMTRLKYLLSHIIDCPHETPSYSSDGNYYVIRTADQDVAKLRSDEDMYRLDEGEYQNRIRRQSLDKDDIVYGREGERWGLACLVPESNKYCLGQRMMQFRCHNLLFLPQYAVYALSSQYVYQQGFSDTMGSTSPHVNISSIRNFCIPIPPLNEQFELAQCLREKCSQIDQLISIKQSKIEKLEQYKRSLIYEYVTGKKEVTT